MSSLIYSSFEQLRHVPPDKILTIGDSVPLPKFETESLHALTQEVLNKVKSNKSLIHINPGVVVVGDLHGNIYDLFRIMNTNGYPPSTNYLFLGDYVDRGEYSTEVISFLLSMMVLYPDNVFLLRGNHEFREVNSSYGFKAEIQKYYEDESLYEEYNEIFDYLPIAAIIGTTIFCVHGGIGPELQEITQIDNFVLPIKEDEGIIGDLVWSDPDKKINHFSNNMRGKGCRFGQIGFESFCRNNDIYFILRGHQCVYNGFELFFKNRLITVFSSSSYSTDFPNSAAFVIVTNALEIKPTSLPLIPIRKRQNTFTFDVVPISLKQVTRCISLLRLKSQSNLSKLSSSTRRFALKPPTLPTMPKNSVVVRKSARNNTPISYNQVNSLDICVEEG